jgi:phosphatidylglycerol---prolipoprotein diacylglyceryl transferase
VAIAVYLNLRRRFGDPIATTLRWAVIAVAIAGAALGSKLLFFLEDPRLTLANLHNPAYFVGGKTIVGALAFGLLAVELIKRYIGLRASTGDLYAIPLAVGIAIGRIGCFLTGLSDNTYGTPTNLPWGVNFGDGIPRHPTQLYEIAFLLLLIPILYRVLARIVMSREASHREGHDFSRADRLKANDRALAAEGTSHFQPGDAFKLFMVAYMTFRLLCDFLKPYPRLFLGLEGIQWVCVLTILYYSRDMIRWIRSS